jgi:uncharacterized protein
MATGPQPPLTPEPPYPGEVVATTSDDRLWATLCHLSPFLSLVAAGMTFIGPLVCWLVKKDQSRFVDFHGKESLNFQINLYLYLAASVVFAIVTCGIGAIVAVAVFMLIGVYATVMQIIAAIKANQGEYFRYPFILRIIR